MRCPGVGLQLSTSQGYDCNAGLANWDRHGWVAKHWLKSSCSVKYCIWEICMSRHDFTWPMNYTYAAYASKNTGPWPKVLESDRTFRCAGAGRTRRRLIVAKKSKRPGGSLVSPIWIMPQRFKQHQACYSCLDVASMPKWSTEQKGCPTRFFASMVSTVSTRWTFNSLLLRLFGPLLFSQFGDHRFCCSTQNVACHNCTGDASTLRRHF